MELKEFVKETLVQIVQGVEDAKGVVGGKNGEINPRSSGPPMKGVEYSSRNHETIRLVDFDVAVTVSEGSGTKGRAGISVWGIGAGAQGESTSASSSVSRIKFQVPITLP